MDKKKDPWANSPKCLTTVQVNNHLGYLHNKFTLGWIPSTFSSTFPLSQIQMYLSELPYHDLLPNIRIVKNAVPQHLADELRNFVSNVPLNVNRKLLNDTDNKPLDSAYFTDQRIILQTYEKRICDPSKWIWEHYNHGIWRLSPPDLAHFLGSPIPGFFTFLENMLLDTIRHNMGYSNLQKGTWVIQRVAKGESIDIHSDENGSRKISFVYYLTADNWTEEDGGGLFVLDVKEKIFRRINPDFNSLVMWEVNSDPSGLHYVEEVKASNEKPRIALVGFFDYV